MTDNITRPQPITVLGLGAMGAALVRSWLSAGHPVTVWNRTPARADPLADAGATVASTAAEAVAASPLVIACLLDDASVDETLTTTDLAGRDLVNITTSTPAEARARATWAEKRGARYLDGGIMAVPPMIGVEGSGAYVFYSGDRHLFEERREALTVPAGATFVGEDAGFAALHDVALLSAMNGMFAGVAHAFALVRREDIRPSEFAPLLSGWLVAMSQSAGKVAEQLESDDYTKGVVSNLAMQVAGSATLLRTAEEQGVSAELIAPYLALMERRLAEGHPDEDTTGVVELLIRR
ncbi:NAD(P)-dependent oxidoreductase [Streptomyces radicis]|uniref:NAD(P)-dependent oxidoreductase n=1 Tax=Streptomyces radicis TaxID=1750517 RepID=A0A3A9W4X7_9ACTN|nr:NAD(P)-binding domain-containing protein [Streptomyces radicis]RKN04304.1 NAD(P)-dependent oxidoreductase [Streptomyces radicis]RKN14811.1 NAD(P)-dependent oxidoreductase [Streptomyces radicis]